MVEKQNEIVAAGLLIFTILVIGVWIIQIMTEDMNQVTIWCDNEYRVGNWEVVSSPCPDDYYASGHLGSCMKCVQTRGG